MEPPSDSGPTAPRARTAQSTAIAALALAVLGLILGAGVVGTVGRGVSSPGLVAALAMCPMMLLLTFGLKPLVRALPSDLDEPRSPRRLALWAVVALLVLFQTTRFSAFMVEPNFRWGSAFPFDASSVRHTCLPAYLYAAELAERRPSDLYRGEVYRRVTPGQAMPTEVVGMEQLIEDPFLYPPTFLLGPTLALHLSKDFLVLRTGWFVLSALAFLAIAVGLAVWIGGRMGSTVGLLLALLWISIPTLFNLQYGQFHLLAIALAVAAMVLFARGRRVCGGLLLAIAIAGKIFPAILVVYLVAARRGRDLLATAIWGGTIVLGSLALLGPEPFHAYLGGQAADVASGEAVSYFETNYPTVLNNISIYGAVPKLRWLGVASMTPELARGLSAAFAFVPLLLAIWIAQKHVPPVRGPNQLPIQQAAAWLALLNLTALLSPNAPGIYVLVGSLWLLSLLLARTIERGQRVVGLACLWLLFLGIPPLPSRGAMLTLSLVIQTLCLGVNLLALVRGGRGLPPQAEPRSETAAANG